MRIDPQWHPHVAPILCDERRAIRILVDWDAAVTLPTGGRTRCWVLDISNRGCRIRAETPSSVGTCVNVLLPRFGSVTGWVAWRADGEAGIDFAHPLQPSVLEEILRRNGRRDL